MKKRIVLIILAVAAAAAFKFSEPANAVFFQDTASHWAADIIDIWSDYGILEGINGRFYPDVYIKRVDLAVMVCRVMGYKEMSTKNFKDIDGLTEEQRSAILKLNKAGIMLGSDGYMRPNDNISREEAAVMLGRMLRIDNKNPGSYYFNDMYQISDWAYNTVSVMASKGYMNGRGNKIFDPKANITRAEVVQVLSNMISGYYSKSGSYSISTLGNVVINASGIELRQVAITGDLFITEGVADGIVTLNNVTVEGNVYVLGGGPSSIKLLGNSRLGTVYHEKVGQNGVKYAVQPPSVIDTLYVKQGTAPVIYEGFLRNFYINDTNQSVTLINATIGNLVADAPGIVISTSENTSISNAKVNFEMQMLGKGIFSNVTIAPAANGSSFERQPKTVSLPAGLTVFLAGETFKNVTTRTQTINAVEDNIIPTVTKAEITASNLTIDGATFSWNAASDNISDSKTLRYALYYSTSPNMYSVSLIEANGIMVTNFMPAKLNAVVKELKTEQTYYFNVIVKDQADNKNCYATFTLKAGKDTAAPTLSNSYITTSNQKTNEVTLSWERANDNVTPQSKLIYTLYQSDSNNLGSVETCEKNGKPVMKSAADVTTYTIKSLKPELSYYFNVIVSDEAGNKTCYNTLSLGKDSSPPTLSNSTITTSGLKATEISLSWTKATDNLSDQTKLKYIVYRSESNELRTVEDCEQYGKVIMSASANKDSYKATGLKEYNLYYFNVVVVDEAGNKACYTPVAVTPVTDTMNPVIPSDSTISVLSTSEDSARLTWKAASDNVTPPDSLKYSVYYSSQNNISTVSQCIANGKSIMSPTAGKLFCDFLQPADSTGMNYINVVVEDEKGNKSCYTVLELLLGADTTPPTIPSSLITLKSWTGNSATLTWASANDRPNGIIGTATPELMYSVFYTPATGAGESSFDSVSEIEDRAIWNSGYSQDMRSITVSGLTENSRYYVNVIVKDKAGLKACYTPKLVITDNVAPDVSASIIEVVSNTTNERNLSITWGRAQDVYTSQNQLYYALYYSVNTEYSTLADIEANGRPLSAGYVRDLTSGSITDIFYNLKYYFYVIVRDEAGNKVKYSTKEFVLKDTTPPDLPTDYATTGGVKCLDKIHDAESDTYTVKLSWKLSTDAVAGNSLIYKVYVSSDKYSTLDALIASNTPEITRGRDMDHFDHSGQVPGKYYYHVVVEDDAGNMSLYPACEVIVP